jgi:hypothetical protein
VSDTAWKRGPKFGNWTTQYRGINLVIRINPRIKLPKAIEFYIGRKLNASAPVACSIEDAKWIAVEAADKQTRKQNAANEYCFYHDGNQFKGQSRLKIEINSNLVSLGEQPLEDQFVRATKAMFAILRFTGSFDELRCREIFRRTRCDTDPDTPTFSPTAAH